MPVPLARRLFTVDEYHRMGEAGIFHEDDRVELIDGEIVQMTPIGVARNLGAWAILNRDLELRVGVSHAWLGAGLGVGRQG